jgi:hypothetical protein
MGAMMMSLPRGTGDRNYMFKELNEFILRQFEDIARYNTEHRTQNTEL